MRINNLYKAEIYRFFHSIFIFIFMAAGLFGILFLASDNSDVLLGDGTVEGALNSTMRIANLIIALVVSVGISSYAGKEFRLKTICYEIMGGHSLWKISLTKTITCGLFASILLQLGILFFFVTVPGALQMYSLQHILFMFIIIFHIMRGYGFCKIAFSKTLTCAIILPVLILICMMIYLGIFCGLSFCELYFRGCGIFFLLFHLCSASILYVLLCRTPVIGGSLAFFRFFVIEAVLPTGTQPQLMKLNVFNQWYQLVDAKTPLTIEWLVSILGIAAVEYGILQMVLSGSAKWRDM